MILAWFAILSVVQEPVVTAEFIYERAPFPSCHASTIVDTPAGLVASWFGGTDEGKPDVGIWVSRRDQDGWTTPVEVADGRQPDGKRHPAWNPVLFQPKGGPLLLFYKVGPSPSSWWGLLRSSDDGGRTWSAPRPLPKNVLGPIKNKPVALPDGSILCPTSSEHDGWKVHFERTPDLGRTWEATGPVDNGAASGAIQPTVLFLPGGKLLALCRTRGKPKTVLQTTSSDGGRTWTPMAATSLPNPNSGIDGVTLADGRHLLVYNPVEKGRTPLSVAVSADAATWRPVVALENVPGEYSYPAILQSADGLVHVTYTWRRERIRHVVIDPANIKP